MAGKAKEKKVKGYLIAVETNPDFVGIGAGGVQFAYGKAMVAADSAIVGWYREHDGYSVTEILDEENETPAAQAE